MRVRALSQYLSAYPNPIEFDVGDVLHLGKRDTEYPGWIWVRTPSGNEGWAPEQLIDITNPHEGTGAEAYLARELTTQIGEELVVLKEMNNWYWVENNVGDTGWVPADTTCKV